MKLRVAVSVGTAGALALGGQLVLVPPASAATSWFVDGTSPACSDSGSGTSAAPFCSISGAAAKAVSAGDTVTVAPGTYREQVTVGASGGPGAPITFVAAGPGVVVSGTRSLSAATWAVAAGGTYSTPYSPPSAPKQVFLDGARLTVGTSATGLVAGSFFYDATAKVLYVNLGGPSPSGRALEAGAQTYGFNLAGRSDVVVDGFTTTGQNGVGLRVSAGSAVTLRNVTSTFSGSYGISVEASSANVSVTNATVRSAASIGIRLAATTASTVTGAHVTGSGNHGISLQGSVGDVVQASESADNSVTAGLATAAGIDVSSTSTDTVLRGNVVHGNQDSGIQVYSGSSRTLVVRNTSWGNGNHGFDTLASTGVSYVSNTAYGNHDDGFSIGSNSTGASLRNNISVDNGLATGRHDLFVEQTSTTGFTADRDVFWDSRWVPAVRIGLTRYQTMAEFAAGTGLEGAGLGTDPQFVDAAAHDFRLAPQSAAIDAADAGAPGFEATDAAGHAPTDDPTVPDRGAGTPAYADRGALERLAQTTDQATNAPHAALVLSATTGQAPPGVTVTADARGSSDVDAQGIATYTFDFGDGTVVGPQASPVATHALTAAGTHLVGVTVTDTGGLTGHSEVPVTLTDRTPVTYHVDGRNAACSDAADGTTTPFCSISRGATVALAGDTVVVEAGDYREQVTPAGTGLPTAPLTFRANGAVRVLGSTDVGSPAQWTATGTNAWKATVAAAAPVTQVLRGGVRLAAASSATTTTPGTYFYDAATSALYIDAGGANPASGTTIEASTRSYGFKLWSARSVVVDGFTTQGQNGVGVSIQDASDVVVSSATATLASTYGFSSDRSNRTRVSGSTATANGSIGIRIATSPNAVVSGNTSASNGYHGISVQGSAGAAVADNVTHDNVQATQRLAAGIDISLGSTAAVIERNTSYANQDSGIEIYTGSNDATVRRNITYDNGDHGIDCFSSTGDHVVGNTVVGNATAGINLEGTCSGAVAADNVSVDNAVGSTRTIGDIRVDTGSAPGSKVDRNLVHQTAGGPLYEWASKPYTTVAAFRTASGQGADDLDGAPGFVDGPARNLALTVTSPAIDSADLGVVGASVTDHDGVAPVDVPTVTDTGAGTPAYGDRGALEFADVPRPVGPTAALSANPASGSRAPATVQLSAAATTAGDTPIATYTFACGDGTKVGPQTGPTASCTYAAGGTYTASVRVVDQAGLESTATTSVGVLAPLAAPTAALVAAPASGARAPATVQLSAAASTAGDTPIATYTFACGDGTTVGPQAGPTASCTYAAGGTYTASVRVVDQAGLESTATTSVGILAAYGAPRAAFTATPRSGVMPFRVTLNAAGSTDPEKGTLTYTFVCGNGTTVGPRATATATCTYTRTGTFTVQVTVRSSVSGLTGRSTTTITSLANKPPTASLRLVLGPARVAPATATFDASGSRDPERRPLKYTFTCGNGTRVGPQLSPRATCRYRQGGTFRVTVTVTDDAGNRATSVPVTVRVRINRPPTARLTVTLSRLHAPTVATLRAYRSTDPEGRRLTYTYSCGNGRVIGPTTASTAKCTYLKRGTYYIRLTVKDDIGQRSSVTVRIRV